METFVQRESRLAGSWRRLCVRVVLAFGCVTALATSAFVPPHLTDQIDVDVVSPEQPSVDFVVLVNAAALEQTSGARLTVQVSTDQRSPFELDIAGDSLNPQETRLPVAPNRDAAEGGAGNAAVAGSLAIATPVLAPISAEPIRDPDPTAAELPQTFAMTQVVLSLESCTPKKDCTLDFHTVASGWTTERLSLSVSVTLDHTSYTSCSGWEAADEYSQEAKVELKNDD